ncbi:Hypothetical protein R9X50_00655100 [Acrodontium crateriforme]|uniref:Major facilitator superfamily (MFS) profile domain-containing protein n=1 Tax=Acrodontium crateriforme TaxID=150365 RepID=A0AAQ3MB60_9PEZI|nr:Hypothetical protein R9X50_00655100 [Acrodontium crateriforme]
MNGWLDSGVMACQSDKSTPCASHVASNPVEARFQEPPNARQASLDDTLDSSRRTLANDSSITVLLKSATTSSSILGDTAEGTTTWVATSRNYKKVYRKIDKRILMWYCLIFAVLKIAEKNISNAAIINLEQGTGIKVQLGNLSSSQWAWIMSIFSHPYIVLDAFSVTLTKKLTPRIWLGRIMATWGVISMCQAATKSYAGLLVCRFFLGVAEAGFAPGAVFHISFRFPADHLPLRIAILSATSIFSGAFSGVIDFAISFLNGAGGLPGWRYLFLLEGAPAVVVGIVTCFTLPNYPQDAKFLSQKERDLSKSCFKIPSLTDSVLSGYAKRQAAVELESYSLKLCLNLGFVTLL